MPVRRGGAGRAEVMAAGDSNGSRPAKMVAPTSRDGLCRQR
jgi:hypothetical protein